LICWQLCRMVAGGDYRRALVGRLMSRVSWAVVAGVVVVALGAVLMQRRAKPWEPPYLFTVSPPRAVATLPVPERVAGDEGNHVLQLALAERRQADLPARRAQGGRGDPVGLRVGGHPQREGDGPSRSTLLGRIAPDASHMDGPQLDGWLVFVVSGPRATSGTWICRADGTGMRRMATWRARSAAVSAHPLRVACARESAGAAGPCISPTRRGGGPSLSRMMPGRRSGSEDRSCS
jgi:hypothetical protein